MTHALLAVATSLDALPVDQEPQQDHRASVALGDLTRYANAFRAARHRLSNAVNRDDCLTGQERALALRLADEMRKEAALLRAAANVRDPLCLNVEDLDEAGIDAGLVAAAQARRMAMADRVGLPSQAAE